MANPLEDITRAYAKSNLATQHGYAGNVQQPAAITPAAEATGFVEQSKTQSKPMSYADMFVALNPYRPQTVSEREAERKRNQRNNIFAAISDGISALSNLYYTTKGAPNSFNGGSTLSGKMYERQQQLQRERNALDQQYLNGYIRAMEMDRAKDTADRNWRYQLENLAYNRARQSEADKRAAAKEERDKQAHDVNMMYSQALADVAKAQAQAAPNLEAAKIKAQEALTAQRSASAQASRAKANNAGTTGNQANTKLWPYPINGEDIELPQQFWSNSGEINALYSMLPEDVRDSIEKEYTSTGRLKKTIKPTLDQKRQAIMDHATPEIMNRLRAKSQEFGGSVAQKETPSIAPWLNADGNNSAQSGNNKAPWL